MFEFLTDDTKDWLSYPAMAFAMVGTIFFLSSFIPTFYTTYKTKNTVGINRKMFFVHMLASSLFCLGAIAMIISGFTADKRNTMGISSGFVFACLNATTSLCSVYIFRVKQNNLARAEEMGISEQEYYDQVIAPSLLKSE